MTESVLLARLEFFGSEAKDERGLGKTLRGGKLRIVDLGVLFLNITGVLKAESSF